MSCPNRETGRLQSQGFDPDRRAIVVRIGRRRSWLAGTWTLWRGTIPISLDSDSAVNVGCELRIVILAPHFHQDRLGGNDESKTKRPWPGSLDSYTSVSLTRYNTNIQTNDGAPTAMTLNLDIHKWEMILTKFWATEKTSP